MADGMMSNAAKALGEAVIKPVSDEVGKMVEEGVSSVTNKPPADDQKKKNPNDPNPQQLAQDDAKKKQNVMQFLQNYKQQEQALKQKRDSENQKKDQEESQKTEQIRQFEFQKKQQQRQTMQQAELMRAKTKSERKGGAG